VAFVTNSGNRRARRRTGWSSELPAVPATATTIRGSADEEPDQPQQHGDDEDVPEHVHGEAEAPKTTRVIRSPRSLRRNSTGGSRRVDIYRLGASWAPVIHGRPAS